MDIKTRARTLRRDMTDAERVLWQHLRNRQLNGIKFKRQVPIGKYIVDFLSVETMLIIEIDGGQHSEQIEYGAQRTRFLESKGYHVVRYWNHEVLGNFEGVIETLTLTLSQREREIR